MNKMIVTPLIHEFNPFISGLFLIFIFDKKMPKIGSTKILYDYKM